MENHWITPGEWSAQRHMGILQGLVTGQENSDFLCTGTTGVVIWEVTGSNMDTYFPQRSPWGEGGGWDKRESDVDIQALSRSKQTANGSCCITQGIQLSALESPRRGDSRGRSGRDSRGADMSLGCAVLC